MLRPPARRGAPLPALRRSSLVRPEVGGCGGEGVAAVEVAAVLT